MMETSKKILGVSWAVAIVLTALVTLGVFCGVEVSSITQVACLAWGEVTAANSIYYWKAKNENRSKHAMQLVRDLAKEYGIEYAARIAEIVLKE